MRVPTARHTVMLFACAATAALDHASAQTLGDLQPGRNFLSSAAFGADRSANLDPGDVDNDGDMDVIVANGNEGAAQLNRIFINLGGLQSGTVGAFADETATRFAGVAVDTSKDVEFVDFDADGDLDIGVANRGNPINGGEVSRFYANLGGLQGGTVGYFAEETNERWGTLVSVPLHQQVFGGNVGPFIDFSCDCDFADIDDDGDNDLFHSSYGPNFDGTRDSRVFLNNGLGVFNELSPWANASADIKVHTLDMDLVDLDGDFDIDIAMSSRNSQARTYMNNSINGIGPTLFNDITQSAFINNGIVYTGIGNYEVESGDVDGDGDFDLWMKDFNSTVLDRLLRNNGFTAGVGYDFTKMDVWIKNDTFNEQSIAFTDYDADGDLDAFSASFFGTNYLYQSGLAQGLNFDSVGLYHRTGVGAGLSPNPELSATDNGSTSLDGDIADVDNDGDDDLLICNDSNQQNRLQTNLLGVPDTHAPGFYKLTLQSGKPNGTGTVIHAQIRDNASYPNTFFYPTVLIHSVNGGAPQSVSMFAQGSMQFRAVIPAQTDAVITYHVECTDLAGNTGISDEVCFKQGAPSDPWSDLGFGLAGISGVPSLIGTGTLVGGCELSIDLTNARPATTAGLFVSLSSVPIAFKGGTLAAFPTLPAFPVILPTSAGSITIPATMPAGANGLGLQLFLQYAIADAAAVNGIALSNAIRGDVP